MGQASVTPEDLSRFELSVYRLYPNRGFWRLMGHALVARHRSRPALRVVRRRSETRSVLVRSAELRSGVHLQRGHVPVAPAQAATADSRAEALSRRLA